jgi:hypothetical protein
VSSAANSCHLYLANKRAGQAQSARRKRRPIPQQQADEPKPNVNGRPTTFQESVSDKPIELVQTYSVIS